MSEPGEDMFAEPTRCAWCFDLPMEDGLHYCSDECRALIALRDLCDSVDESGDSDDPRYIEARRTLKALQ